MFGWLRRIGKKKTPPETTERVEKICKNWKEQLDHNERLRQQFLQEQEFARLQYYRELPPTVLIAGIRDPMRSRRLFHTCLHETRESLSAKSTNQAAEP